MSNSTGSNFANKNLTFDPPTRLPELIQNVIRSSHGHSTPSLKISCKSVQPCSRNVADKEISIAASEINGNVPPDSLVALDSKAIADRSDVISEVPNAPKSKFLWTLFR